MARPRKQTSLHMASLAARIMDGYEPTYHEIRSMAASLLTQHEKKIKTVRKRRQAKKKTSAKKKTVKKKKTLGPLH